jgi:hypothetical protein
MSQEAIDYLKEHAATALSRCSDRVADLKFFDGVKKRLVAGEDLSGELPQLKHVSSKDAAFIVDRLKNRCYDDMVGYWAMPSNSGIASEVSYEVVATDLIPRFTAKYATKTEVGAITITASSKGNYTDFTFDTGRVKKMDTEAALRELGHQLLLARLQQTD